MIALITEATKFWAGCVAEGGWSDAIPLGVTQLTAGSVPLLAIGRMVLAFAIGVESIGTMYRGAIQTALVPKYFQLSPAAVSSAGTLGMFAHSGPNDWVPSVGERRMLMALGGAAHPVRFDWVSSRPPLCAASMATWLGVLLLAAVVKKFSPRPKCWAY